MPKPPVDFSKNVFINCPFDDFYTPLFNAIVFAMHELGLNPRCALEASNAGQFRLNRILDIISDCKFSIHDLSRTELDAVSGLPRFNMPFELGLDLGCQRFGNSHQREKICLVLDIEPYRYQKFISDISGQDIHAHSGDERQVVEIVRNWVRLESDPQVVKIPSGAKIFQRYQEFQEGLPDLLNNLDWDPKQLPFVDFSYAVALWIRQNPI